MVRGGHGLPKLSLGPAIPYPSTPCRRASLETALQLFQGWPAHRAGLPVAVFYPLGHPTPYAYNFPEEIILEVRIKAKKATEKR
jgi:hypothetical protein